MQSLLRKIAVAVALVATVAAAVMRIVFTPSMQDAGESSLSYAVIALLAAAFAAVFVLVLAGKGRQPQPRELSAHARLPMAISSLLAGGVLATASLYDGWVWLCYQRTPPPNDSVISSLDGGALFLTLIFGILGGIFLLWLGISLAGGGVRRTSRMALAALAPVAWIWFRLVRYELSYASAVQVSQSFYDFVMLIFTMLFLFSFARYITGTGEQKPLEKSHRMLVVYALCTVIMSLSGPVTSFVLYVSGRMAAYNAGSMAGITDLCMGIFALCTALTLVFAHPLPCAEEDEKGPEGGEPAGDTAEGGQTPSVEEILREIQGDQGGGEPW